MGTSSFAIPSFNSLLSDPSFDIVSVFTNPDRPSSRGQKVLKSAVSRNLEGKYKGKILKPKSMKDKKMVDIIKEMKPDLIYVVSYGQILPEAILNIPKFGCINLHASLLPIYRGPSPIQMSILEGADKTGVTFFKLTKGVDDGPIIWSEEVPLSGNETYESLHDYLSVFGSKLVSNVLKKYVNGEIEPVEQDHSLMSRSVMIHKKDGLIEWGFSSAEQIERDVRAYCPWPGTYTKFKKKNLKILEVRVCEKRPHMLPGTVFMENGRCFVRAKNKSVELLEIQLEGKKRSTILEFVNGHKDFVSTILD